MRRVYGAALIVLAMAGWWGCATRPSGGERPVSDAADRGAITAGMLFSPGPSEVAAGVFDPETGDWLGVQTGSATGMHNGGWTTETVFEGGPPRRAGYVRLGDGSVALAWSRSVKDTDPGGPARLYVFDPPLLMAPASLRVGEVFEAESGMTERDPRDETRVALKGRARRRLRLESPGESGALFGNAPGGLVAAGEMVITVGPAQAKRKTWTVITPDGRSGEEVVDYSIRVLGLRFKRERTRLVPRGGGVAAPGVE